MRRSQKPETPRLSPQGQLICALALSLTTTSSDLEIRYWQQELEKLLLKVLRGNKQEVLDAAVEHLYKTNLDAHGVLMERLEALTEAVRLEHQGKSYDVLLVIAPVLAWTRFSITSGPLSSGMHAKAEQLFRECILMPDVQFKLAPALYAVDQLPFSHTEIYRVTARFGEAVLNNQTFQLADVPETVPFLADIRYLMAAVVVPAGSPIFAWQQLAHVSRIPDVKAECLAAWQTQMMPMMEKKLHGCNVELMLPDAFFRACRAADRRIRPASIRAAVNFMTFALDVEPDDLCVVIGGFGENGTVSRIAEYRIGFALRTNRAILYGVVWPLYGQDEWQQAVNEAETGQYESSGQMAQILQLLETLNVPLDRLHTECFPLDYCEDCGAPLFVDNQGELVHAEMPEEAQREHHLH